MARNMVHGHVTYQYVDGAVYNGDWKNDIMHGHGIFNVSASASVAVDEGE